MEANCVMFISCLSLRLPLTDRVSGPKPAGDSDGSFTIQGRVYLPTGAPLQRKVDVETPTPRANVFYERGRDFPDGQCTRGQLHNIGDAPGLPAEREALTIDAVPRQAERSVCPVPRVAGKKKAISTRTSLFKDVRDLHSKSLRRGVESLRKATQRRDRLFDEAIAAFQFCGSHIIRRDRPT